MNLDEFSDDKEIQRLRKMDADQKAILNHCKQIIFQELALRELSRKIDISSSSIVKSMGSLNNVEYFASSDSNLNVCLIAYHGRIGEGVDSASGYENYLLGILNLQKQYPLTLISKQTIGDIISSLFTSSRFDFPKNPKFSQRFHTITKDEDQLRVLLANKNLEELISFPELEIELIGSKCFFRTSQSVISEKVSEEFVVIVHILKKIFT